MLQILQSLTVTTTFPNSQVIFEKGSGQIVGYASNSATITFFDAGDNNQKVIQLNRYGVITGVN
jgi:hypothetical protein